MRQKSLIHDPLFWVLMLSSILFLSTAFYLGSENGNSFSILDWLFGLGG